MILTPGCYVLGHFYLTCQHHCDNTLSEIYGLHQSAKNYCYTAGISLGTVYAFTGYFVIKPMSSNIAKTVMSDGNIAMLPANVDHCIRSI